MRRPRKVPKLAYFPSLKPSRPKFSRKGRSAHRAAEAESTCGHIDVTLDKADDVHLSPTLGTALWINLVYLFPGLGLVGPGQTRFSGAGPGNDTVAAPCPPRVGFDEEPPMHLLLPLLPGMVYVAGALFLKRAADLRADVWRTTRACNVATALMFAPLVVLGGTIPGSSLWWQPALVGILFVVGQVLTLLALKVGDVSVATPVMGVKILLVAVLVALLVGEPLGAHLWVAALLSSLAIDLGEQAAEIHARTAHRLVRSQHLASE